MKKLYILSLLLFTSLISFGQVKSVDEINVAMSEGTNRGFKVLIPETTKKDAVRAWEKYMKSYAAKTVKIKKTNEYKSSEASMPSISDNPATTYATFQETPEGVYMNTFIYIGNAYLNSRDHPQKTDAYKKMFHAFAKQTARSSLQKKIDDQERKLDRLEREQKSLVKAKEGYEKSIVDAKERIATNENNIETNLVKQKDKKKEITDQKSVTNNLKAKLKRY